MVWMWKKTAAKSLGTGTSEVSVAAFKVPEWVRLLGGVKVSASQITPTANEGLIAKGRVTSNDLSIEPYEYLLPSDGTIDATTAGFKPGPKEYIPWNFPVNGGEQLDFQFTALRSNTVAPFAWIDILVAQDPMEIPTKMDHMRGVTRFGKVGSLTATVDGTATGTAYTITGAEMITDVYGIVVKDTMADSKPAFGYFTLESSGFVFSPIEYHDEGQGAVLGATDAALRAKLTHEHVGVPTASTTIITDKFTQEGGVAITSDDWITGINFKRANI